MQTNITRLELEQRGIPFSEEQFLRQIRNGNREVVELFLLSGVSPNAVGDGESALAIAVTYQRKEIAEVLLKAGADPLNLVDRLMTKSKGKDSWEKLANLSGVFTFMASLLIAGVGWYFTNAYNSRQLELTAAQGLRDHEYKGYQNRLSELQTVEKMIPHLAKDESSKRVALLAISVLASPKLAAQFGELYGGQGSLDALRQIATASPTRPAAPAVSALTSLAAQEGTEGATPARDALAAVLQGKEQSIVQLRLDDRSFCNGFVVDAQRGWILTTAYCLEQGLLPKNRTRDIVVQLWDGTRRSVVESRPTSNNLLAFVRMGGTPLRQLEVSANQFRAGETVTKLAFDLSTKDPTRQLRVQLGRVIAIGQINFGGGTGAPQASGTGLTVMLPEDEKVLGTAGAPLLDREGNVACMTYQGDQNGMEQCVAANEIREALKAITKT